MPNNNFGICVDDDLMVCFVLFLYDVGIIRVLYQVHLGVNLKSFDGVIWGYVGRLGSIWGTSSF